VAAMIAERLLDLESDQEASYAALCADVATIVAVAGLPRSSREDGSAVTRAYAAALRTPSIERWRAFHRAVTALVAGCAAPASHALDFPAVSACVRLRTFLSENADLADGAVVPRPRTAKGVFTRT
jgi:hypothetical protein